MKKFPREVRAWCEKVLEELLFFLEQAFSVRDSMKIVDGNEVFEIRL